MKSFLQLILLSIITNLYAQNHRFFYELDFKKDSLQSKYSKDFYILDISPKSQKFYNYEYFKNDSIQKVEKNDFIFSYPNLDLRLVHEKNDVFSNYFVESPQYYVQKTQDKQLWNITNDKKKIGNYNVQKATTNYGGRSWIAWFTPDIPLVFGPYKFFGLPGLILELSDTKQNFKFVFKGNQNLKVEQDTSLFLETLNGEKPIEVNEMQRQKLKVDYYLNPLKDFQDSMFIENEKGEKVEVNVKELTEKQQKFLRLYNNPIELDKVIVYPK